MRRFRLMVGGLILATAASPALAAQAAESPGTEVEQLRQERYAIDARLRAAEARAEAERELTQARAAADDTDRRLQAATMRLAALQNAPGAPAPLAPPAASNVKAAATQIAAEVVAEQERRDRQSFGGIEFGVGISFTLDVGSNDRVTEAMVTDGIVRVTNEDNGRARIMLESHYFFKPRRCPFGLGRDMCGFGPFIALQPGTDEIIEAIAIGAMIGLRKSDAGTESFNLGLGLVIDPNTRVLGDGIIANQPLPGGETEIRFKEEMQTGILLLASFGF